jgi:hypothetical protein
MVLPPHLEMIYDNINVLADLKASLQTDDFWTEAAVSAGHGVASENLA